MNYFFTILFSLVLLILLLVTKKTTTVPKISLVTTFATYDVNAPPCSDSYLQKLTVSSWETWADEIIVLADDENACSELRRLSSKLICHKHNCQNWEYGKPTMSCLLQSSEWLAKNDIIIFSNPDIIYENVQVTVAALTQQFKRFLAVGARYDTSSVRICNTKGSLTVQDILTAKKEHGVMHTKWAMDYFLFSKESLPLASMPPYIIGNWRWDNWLLDETIRYNTAAVIEATETIGAIHLEDTVVSLNNRTAAKYNNDLWYAASGGKRPDPFPAGLGEMQYAPYLTEWLTDASVKIITNETAMAVTSKYVVKRNDASAMHMR